MGPSSDLDCPLSTISMAGIVVARDRLDLPVLLIPYNAALSEGRVAL